MMQSREVLSFLRLLRRARDDNEHFYMNGGCWKLFTLLRSIYPEAAAYHTVKDIPGHVATKIGKHLYDIRGRVRRPWLYDKMEDIKLRQPHRWKML